MKYIIAKTVGLLALALPLSALADFTDNCTTLNTSLWTVANYGAGRGSVLTADVAPSGGGVMNFKAPANTYNGGEIYSKSTYSYGQASASFKCAGQQGILNSIYMYQGVGASSDEIDIEIYKNSGGTWEIAFTVYKAGTITYQTHYYPSFDPSAGYNTYLIDWSTGAVNFYVNGALQKSFASAGNMPTHAMKIQLIDWWPTWLTASQSSSDKYMQVNWISYAAY